MLQLAGSVVPVRTATLTAPTAGILRFVADEGTRLAGGEAAAILDGTGLPAQVAGARAALDAARRREESTRLGVEQIRTGLETSIAGLTQALRIAEAERNRRKASLEAARLSASTEPARARAQQEAAEARVRRLRSGERIQRIRQLEAEVQFKQAESGVAQTAYFRQKKLYGQGYVSAQELELARLSVQRARASELQAQEELRLQREGAHPEEIKEAEQQVEAARQAVRTAEGLGTQVQERQEELAAAEAEVRRAAEALRAAKADRVSIEKARQESRAAAAEARRGQVELDEASDRLRRTTVEAPFSGQVIRRAARPGETVTIGAPLIELVDPDELRFEATLTEKDVARVRPGQPMQVMVPAASAGTFAGRVEEVILAAEPARRVYKVRVALTNTARLRPGLAGAAKLAIPAPAPVISLPYSALRKHLPRSRQAEVLLLDGAPDSGSVQLTPVRVTLGAGTADGVKIVAGLKRGDRVVVSDSSRLDASQPVQAREVDAP
jgi:HlyD family secretion protein